jgi:RNA polymerase sigma-70 factor (ECF subfamily)
MGEPTGDPLTTGLAHGREDAFAALYDRFGPALYRVARLITGSREEAEDAVQEVFVGLVRARRSLAAVANLRAYLFAALRRAAARRAADRGRLRAVPIESVPEPAVAESSGLGLEPAAALEQALRELPPEQRELVVLKIDGGLTFAEVADVLGISPNTAASRYRYALAKLRASLED